MSKFITPVSMACTQEQYERDLRKPLLEMGYEEVELKGFNLFPILVNNFSGKECKVSNVLMSCKNNYVRYFIDHYNPELYLALAATTNETYGIKGEWWVYIGVTDEDFTNGRLYQSLEPVRVFGAFLSDLGLRDGYAYNPLTHFRKATKEEIINHLTKNKVEKKDLRELLQSGRIVEFRDGNTGIIIATHKGLVVQLEKQWIDLTKYYSPNLTNNIASSCDIVRIREITTGEQVMPRYFKDARIIWERKEVKEYTLDEVLEMAGLDKAEVKVKVPN